MALGKDKSWKLQISLNLQGRRLHKIPPPMTYPFQLRGYFKVGAKDVLLRVYHHHSPAQWLAGPGSQSSLGLTARLSVEWDVGSLLPAFLEFFSGTKAPLWEQWLLMEFLLTGGLWRGEQESF